MLVVFLAWHLRYVLVETRYFEYLSLPLSVYCDFIVEFYYMFYFNPNIVHASRKYLELFFLESINANEQVAKEFFVSLLGGKNKTYMYVSPTYIQTLVKCPKVLFENSSYFDLSIIL